MTKVMLATIVCLFPTALTALIYDDGDLELLRRGDADSDGRVDLTDIAVIANWLYSVGPEPPCLNQADVNNDGRVDLSDAIFLAKWLYAAGDPPPPPLYHAGSSICGIDDTPTGCRTSPCD